MKFSGEEENFLAVATNSEQVKVFDRQTGGCQVLCGHAEAVLCLEASVDGQLIVTSSKDKSVRVWKLNSTSVQFHCVAIGIGHTHSVGAVAISRYVIIECSILWVWLAGSKSNHYGRLFTD